MAAELLYNRDENMTTMGRLKQKYIKIPEIDSELVNFFCADPSIEELLNTDPDKCEFSGNVYRKLVEKLRDFNAEEILKILDTYCPSKYWNSITESVKLTRIERIQSEADESIKKQAKKSVSNKSQSTEEVKKVTILFREVGDEILKNIKLFAMSDTGEFFVYQNGVYKSKDISRFISSKIRNTYEEMYSERFQDLNPMITDFIVPSPSTKFINEITEYLRDYTFISRKEVDEAQRKYINFKNGLFDLDAWEMGSHDPEVLSIVQIPVNYDICAECSAIENYFKSCELTEDDVKSLEEFAGYCLTPDVKMQKALMIYGAGSNGKSVFINMLKEIIGYENVSGETLHTLEEDKFRVANLYGKLLNAFPDLKDKSLQTNEVFNTLTGGDKQLTAERKYMNSFNFDPTTKLLFSANRIPFAYSDNYAYYRRWLMIRFPKTFKDEEIDENLIEKLTTESEKSGFLNRMLEGLKRLRENHKFTKDETPEEVAETYRLNSDNVTVFIEKCCRECKIRESPTPKKLVYVAYSTWCESKQVLPVKEREFNRRLEKLGFKPKETTYRDDSGKTVHLSYYIGLAASAAEI